jgi:hypothetical protein
MTSVQFGHTKMPKSGGLTTRSFLNSADIPVPVAKPKPLTMDWVKTITTKQMNALLARIILCPRVWLRNWVGQMHRSTIYLIFGLSVINAIRSKPIQLLKMSIDIRP